MAHNTSNDKGRRFLDLDFTNGNFPPECVEIYRSVYSAEPGELEAMRDKITQEQGAATMEEAVHYRRLNTNVKTL